MISHSLIQIIICQSIVFFMSKSFHYLRTWTRISVVFFLFCFFPPTRSESEFAIALENNKFKFENTLKVFYIIVLPLSVMARQLDRRTAGYLTWKAGHSSCVHTMVVHDTEKGHCVTGVQVYHYHKVFFVMQ